MKVSVLEFFLFFNLFRSFMCRFSSTNISSFFYLFFFIFWYGYIVRSISVSFHYENISSFWLHSNYKNNFSILPFFKYFYTFRFQTFSYFLNSFSWILFCRIFLTKPFYWTYVIKILTWYFKNPVNLIIIVTAFHRKPIRIFLI